MREKHSKNLLYVIPTLHMGGAEHETKDQINYLQKHGFNVFLIVLSNKLALKQKLKLPEQNIKFLNIKGLTTTRLNNFIKFPKALNKLDKAIKQYEINLVISVLPLSHMLLRLHQKFYKTAYKSWCFHKSMQYEATEINTLPKKIVFKINKSLSNRYDYGHIFISKAVKENISSRLVKNGHVLHNALPIKSVNSNKALAYLSENKINVPEYLVIVPGRLHSAKGHLFFLETLYKYIITYDSDEFKILFLGGGPLYSEILEYIKNKNLQEYIYVTDYIENELLLSFIALSNLVVIPSIHEGFGNVAIESLMQGSTILASNTGGLSEIIIDRKNGFLFECLNADDLNQKFVALHQNKTTLDSSMLKKDFINRFTLETQMKKLMEIIEISQ